MNQKKCYEIKFHETDCLNRLKEPVLLNFLQDIAAVNAEENGFGYSKIQDKEIGWFLTKYHIKLFETLKNNGKIYIDTESKGSVRINCIRDFDIYNSEDKKIGEATSSWVLTDLETGKLVLPSDIFDNLPPADKEHLRSNFPKVPMPAREDFKQEFTARYNEIDVNRHVNNAVYLTWATEVLPIDLLLNTRMAEVEIQYKQQVKYGEKVIVTAEYDQDNLIFTEAVKTENGEIACLIRQKRVNC
ncbi:MAG: hypothetical protein K6C94_09155 [Candidatus Gastranaerophilales bacterium]|nr:hypothetical protein [Candidatus Gastranaerophilales bacterium]